MEPVAQHEPMEPVPLIFSCDTEDYETPASDDAELLWARMFARHGIRACFCVVGEEARALRDRGRRDVLQALAGHEIASHGYLVIAPGKSFVYTSFCPLPTPVGAMEGTYTMRREDGTTFEARIGTFVLEDPESLN
jgi:hypothetical protein